MSTATMSRRFAHTAIERALDEAPRSGAAVVVLVGAAGMGRTTLLSQTAAAAAARGAAVLRLSGAPWETQRAYGLLRQLPGLADEDGWNSPFEAAEALIASLEPADDIGPRPTLLVIDDAHLGDPASLEAVVTAVRHRRRTPLVVVLSHPASGHPSGSEAQAVLDRAADIAIHLGPLSGPEVVEIAAAAGVTLHAQLGEHLARHTAGVPAHVVALLEAVPRNTWRGSAPSLPAPSAVQAATEAALSRLSRDALDLLQAATVLFEPVSATDAVALAGSTAPEAAIDELERNGLASLRDRSNIVVIELPNAMVRAAVITQMGMARRTLLHRRAAELVADDASALEHAVEATMVPDAELARRLDVVAKASAAEGGWSVASHLYLLASRMAPAREDREDLLLRAVDAMIGAGEVAAAADYLAEIESLPETAMRNAVLAYLAIVRGRAAEAESRLTRAWQIVSAARHPDVAAVIAQRRVLHHLARCEGESLVRWSDRAVELVGADHPTAVEAQAIRGLGLGSTGRMAEALASYRTLFAHASRGAVGQRVQMGAGWLHLANDEVDLARAELDTAVPLDYLGGSTRISLWARAWLSRTYFVTGGWDQALRVVADGLELADRSGLTLLEPLLHWTATQIHALRGDWDEAARSARSGGQTGADYEIVRVPAYLGRAAVAESRADYAGVLAALGPLTRPGVSADVAEPGFWPWPDVYANALVLEGRLVEADQFLTVQERRARECDHRSAQARLGYARGRLLGAEGDLPGARRSFEHSLELLEPLPLVYDRARVNFAFGQTLRRAGKRRDADPVITAALEDYTSLGATTYVRRCERELKAGGVNAVLRDRPVESLTPQEQVVAGLVSRGMTNREVAAELFLSVKTVQFHLTRVYAKLGVRTRGQLAAVKTRIDNV